MKDRDQVVSCISIGTYKIQFVLAQQEMNADRK